MFAFFFVVSEIVAAVSSGLVWDYDRRVQEHPRQNLASFQPSHGMFADSYQQQTHLQQLPYQEYQNYGPWPVIPLSSHEQSYLQRQRPYAAAQWPSERQRIMAAVGDTSAHSFSSLKDQVSSAERGKYAGEMLPTDYKSTGSSAERRASSSSSLPSFLHGASADIVDEYKQIIRQPNSTYDKQVQQLDSLVKKLDAQSQSLYTEFMRENDDRERNHREAVHKLVAEMSDEAQEQFSKSKAKQCGCNGWDDIQGE